MSLDGLFIAPLRVEDWPSVRAIYEAGIATGNATFETSVPASIFPQNAASR